MALGKSQIYYPFTFIDTKLLFSHLKYSDSVVVFPSNKGAFSEFRSSELSLVSDAIAIYSLDW